MITRDFDYQNGKKIYNVGDIIRVKGNPAEGEKDALGIVAISGNFGSFSVITADGYIGLAERVITEPTGRSFDLSPLFNRLRSGGFEKKQGNNYEIGDIVIDNFGDPGIVFYICRNGDIALICIDGMNLGTSPDRVKATGESFDLAPMFDSIKD